MVAALRKVGFSVEHLKKKIRDGMKTASRRNVSEKCLVEQSENRFFISLAEFGPFSGPVEPPLEAQMT